MQDRAKIVGIKGKFDTMIKAYQKVERQMQKSNKETKPYIPNDNITQFDFLMMEKSFLWSMGCRSGRNKVI